MTKTPEATTVKDPNWWLTPSREMFRGLISTLESHELRALEKEISASLTLAHQAFDELGKPPAGPWPEPFRSVSRHRSEVIFRIKVLKSHMDERRAETSAAPSQAKKSEWAFRRYLLDEAERLVREGDMQAGLLQLILSSRSTSQWRMKYPDWRQIRTVSRNRLPEY